uniref:Uncharacterized protein n=1 Tax=Lactuca sativa TaxID=4236 RepID=A0A9R1XEG5_LACSA|nr:hypothetical protein LSAT_V11C500253080 [Lactuca sativa]
MTVIRAQRHFGTDNRSKVRGNFIHYPRGIEIWHEPGVGNSLGNPATSSKVLRDHATKRNIRRMKNASFGRTIDRAREEIQPCIRMGSHRYGMSRSRSHRTQADDQAWDPGDKT